MTYHTWIIGAGQGLGQAYARAFPNAVLISRSAAPPFAMDVTDMNMAHIQQLLIDYPPQIIVYNAFVARRATASNITMSDLLYDFQVHCVGLVQVLQACEDTLLAAPKPAVIITGGGFAYHPHPSMFSLGIGKAAQLNIAKSLDMQWQDTPVRVGYPVVMGKIDKNTGIDPDHIARIVLDWYECGNETLEIQIP